MRNKDEINTHVYTQEYYLAIKKQEILPSAKTWMDLASIILNDMSGRERQRPNDFPKNK